MHDGRVTQGIVPDAPIGALRFWDSGTSWRDLEPTPGHFTWSGLDAAVAAAENAHARPLLVLGQTPTFYASKPQQAAFYGPGAASPPDLSAWRRYVSAVARRYGDRIDYQVWNEANVSGFWSGTPRQLALLTMATERVIRAEVPKATVVAPPFVLRLPSQRNYFKRFWSLQSDGVDLASAVDAAALSLYPSAEDPPEAVVSLVGYAAKVLAHVGAALPVWNTEVNYGVAGAGPAPSDLSPARQRAFVMRTYLLNAALGVSRVYWYRWDLAGIANTLLTGPDFSTPTLAGRSVSTVRQWLLGARVQPCESSGGVWQCTASKGGQTRTFWWKARGRAERMPARADSWTDANGKVTPCRGDCHVLVSETPVMLSSG